MNLFKGRTAFVAAAAVLALAAASAGQVSAQGFGGGRPAMGSISAIDKADKTITVTNDQTGDSTTVSVSSDTSIITQAASTPSAVKVGDTVRVQGIPTGITATSIVDGEMPRFGRGGGPGGPGGGPGAGGPGGGPGARPGGGQGGRPGGGGESSIQGTVKSLSPLTISVGDGVSLVVSGASKAAVTKISKLTFSDLKIGDRVFAPGQAGDDGVVAATMIGVNIQMGGRGFGGGGFGGGGFGGGRGRRGGGQGGPGGGAPGDGGGADMAPAGPPPPDAGGDAGAPPPPQ
jgi:hypothetical protein